MENNTGVIIKQQKTDWISGLESGIKYQEVTNDWTPFLPDYEPQEKSYTRTQACVTFSALNCIEAQLLQQTGIAVNLSDRFTAKMSGTTPSGNTLQAVLDSIRKDGWLLEEDYPFPENMTPAEYYKEIPQVLKDKALQNKERVNWQVNYEWVNINDCHPDLEAIEVQLKQAPLQRVTSYNSGLCNSEHATMLYGADDEYLWIFDSYNDGIIQKPSTYPMPFLMKIVVGPKVVLPDLIPPLTKDLVFGMRDNEVKYAQQKLIKLGYLSKGLDTGYYWNLTQLAVKKFASDYKVASALELYLVNGKRIGIKTRNKLNSL